MSETAASGPSSVRRCDVCFCGATEPLLQAAVRAARAGRSVIVLDEGMTSSPSQHDRETTSLPHAALAHLVERLRANGGELLRGTSAPTPAGTPEQTGTYTDVYTVAGGVIRARIVLTADEVAHLGDSVDAAIDTGLGSGPSAASANEADWDERYRRGRMWSGKPNASLVAESAGLMPGSALDVGAGEGGDALYLAERGWEVTANDVSGVALEVIARAAAERGVRVAVLKASVNDDHPFGEAQFDLVTAHYASIPRTEDERAVAAILGAVAPGGRLLVVSHDMAGDAADGVQSGERAHQHAATPHDPDAYVRVQDFVAAVTRSDEWAIEVHETRDRPPGAASHHVADVILRARRSAEAGR